MKGGYAGRCLDAAGLLSRVCAFIMLRVLCLNALYSCCVGFGSSWVKSVSMMVAVLSDIY